MSRETIHKSRTYPLRKTPGLRLVQNITGVMFLEGVEDCNEPFFILHLLSYLQEGTGSCRCFSSKDNPVRIEDPGPHFNTFDTSPLPISGVKPLRPERVQLRHPGLPDLARRRRVDLHGGNPVRLTRS